MPSMALSVYLLKDDVATDHDAVKPDRDDLSEHEFAVGDVRGTLFVQQQHAHPPAWLSLLGPYLEPAATDETVASSSAVLILPAAGRRFAVAFGHGRTLLDPRCYVRRFGLRVALNSLDPGSLRGAQARTFGDSVMHTQRQLSREARIDALQVDWQQELVKALEGATRQGTVGRRLKGQDAARVTVDADATSLAALCATLLRLSLETGYLDDYPHIDDIEELTDPDEIATWNERIATRLAQRTWSGIDLYPAELVADDIVDFSVTRRGRETTYDDPSTGVVLGPLIPAMSTTTRVRSILDRTMLAARDAQGQVVEEWPLWDCLYYEGRAVGERVILDGGVWYRIKKTLVDQVDQFVASLTPSGIPLPQAVPNESEGDYNLTAADSTSFALLDQQNIRVPGQSPVEPCDLFTGDRQFIHVKKRKGGSGPLSHLIGQAVVSARLLRDEPDFRAALRDELEAARPGFGALIEESAKPGDYSIVLALITTSGTPDRVAEDLPFFTKVFMWKNVTELRRMGFLVHVDEIRTGDILTGLPKREHEARVERLRDAQKAAAYARRRARARRAAGETTS